MTMSEFAPYGKLLLIQTHRGDDVVDIIARLTEVSRTRYTAAFRSHTGRWEPLPVSGDIAHSAPLQRWSPRTLSRNQQAISGMSY